MTTLQMKMDPMAVPQTLTYARLDGVLASQRFAQWSYFAAGFGALAGMLAMLSQLL